MLAAAQPAPACRQLPLWEEPATVVEPPSTTAPDHFIVLPEVQLASFARRPLAVGVQLAVTRLCMRARRRVPASRADLAAWSDDRATRDDGLGTAIKRALDDLRARGLLAGQADPGEKLWVSPAWGLKGDGEPRPWNWKRRDRGRPRKLTFEKIPIGLIDDYLGLCQTDACDPARVERWFDRPLLDLADIGAYALRWAGIRVAARFLVRLRHLGLLDARDQPISPRDRSVLLSEAAAGTLTTLDDDGQVVQVRLSPIGEHALERLEGVVLDPASSSLAGGGSCGRSNSGSQEAPGDRPSLRDESRLDPAGPAACRKFQRESESEFPSQPEKIMAEEVVVLLDQKLQIGHRLVNKERQIPAEEWFALVALQEECGVTRLLTWQARAAAAGRTQVSAAYYEQCAASEAFGTMRQAQPPAEAPRERAEERQEPITVPTPLAPPRPVRPALDAEQQAALRELEEAAGERVRAPWRLRDTPPACIRAWAQCISHPGLVAYCRLPPLHYAVDQLALCLPPPNAAQLARWAAPVTPGATGAAGTPAGGERWSDAAIAGLVAAGGGLFTLGSDAGEEQAGRPGGSAPLASPPAALSPAATTAPAPRPVAAPESAWPPAGASRLEPLAPSPRPVAALPAAPPSTPPEPDADQRRWSCALGVLQQELPRAQFATWVRGARWGGLADGVATVVAGRPDQADGLRRLAPQLERVLIGVFGQALSVAVREEPPVAAPPESPPPDEPPEAVADDPSDDLARLWSQVSSDLQRRMDRLAYRTWLRGATLVGLTDDTATIQARSDYQRDRLERHEAALIGECLGLRLGRAVRVVITLDGAEPEEARVSTPPRPREEAPPARPAALPARPATPPGPREAHPSARSAPGGPPSALAAPAVPTEAPGRPAWIAPTLWATVPPVLRAMLVSSALRDGQIVSAHPLWRKALDNAAYAEVLARLLAAAERVRSA